MDEITSLRQDPRRPPDAPTPATSSGPTRRSRVSGRDHRTAGRLIGLAVLGHMLRSRRFYERATFTAIALAALGKLSQENQTRILARLAAWNKHQVQLLERTAGREARRLEYRAERQAKRFARKAKSALTQSM